MTINQSRLNTILDSFYEALSLTALRFHRSTINSTIINLYLYIISNSREIIFSFQHLYTELDQHSLYKISIFWTFLNSFSVLFIETSSFSVITDNIKENLLYIETNKITIKLWIDLSEVCFIRGLFLSLVISEKILLINTDRTTIDLWIKLLRIYILGSLLWIQLTRHSDGQGIYAWTSRYR